MDNNKNNKSGNGDDADRFELVIPSAMSDFQGLATVRDLAFVEKNCCGESSYKEVLKTYQTYQQKHPIKVQHCRILRDTQDNNKVVAACQLQLFGDVGDLELPSGLRHSIPSSEDAYIEWIGTHPEYTGKGLGSKLLLWSEEFAREEHNVQKISLEVMKENKGAIRLYERKGYSITKDNNDLCTCCVIFWLMGCRYTGTHTMEKSLSSESDKQGTKKTENAIMDR